MSTKSTKPAAAKPDTAVKPAAAGQATATLATMQPGEIADQAKAWDEARAELAAASSAASAAQVAFDGLAADASDDQRHDALVLLAEAENVVRDAEARIRELTSNNLPTGAASATAHGGNASARPAPAAAEPGSAGGAVRPPATHTPESDDGQGGAGREAGPAGTASPGMIRAAAFAAADRQVDQVIASVQALIAAGDHEAVQLHLAEEVRTAELLLEVGKHVAKRLEAARVQLRHSKTVWPLENVMYAGALHVAGGPSFQIDPDEFAPLQSIGVLTDTNPHEEATDAQA